jgi:hypothetical protein
MRQDTHFPVPRLRKEEEMDPVHGSDEAVVRAHDELRPEPVTDPEVRRALEAVAPLMVAPALASLEAEVQQLRKFVSWLVSMDDPEDVVGREARRSVTLDQIIQRARRVARNG